MNPRPVDNERLAFSARKVMSGATTPGRKTELLRANDPAPQYDLGQEGDAQRIIASDISIHRADLGYPAPDVSFALRATSAADKRRGFTCKDPVVPGRYDGTWRIRNTDLAMGYRSSVGKIWAQI
jgi:hypothetical protein